MAPAWDSLTNRVVKNGFIALIGSSVKKVRYVLTEIKGSKKNYFTINLIT